MTNSNNENPYAGFFKKDGAAEEPAPEMQASEELLTADRGAPEIKVERDKGVNKNLIIAGGLVVVALIIVVGIVLTLINRLSGDEEENITPVENAALSKLEAESLSNIRARMEADKRREEEAQRLERERLAALARERAEREAQESAKNPPAEPAPPPAPALGNLSAQPSEKPLSQRDPEELTTEELAQLRKGRGDVLGYASQVQKKDSGQSTLERPNALGNMLITERHADGYAMLRKSRKYLLMRGSNIPCTIIPRVITNYFSQPTCIVNEDIYSPEGIVLVDRGSKVIGEQRTTLKRGSKRVFIAWADIETPEGVSIKIDSMAADALGGAGVDAWIDNHWVDRFGAAIMLSFLDDFFEIIANEASKGGNQQNWENSTDNASSMAQIALEDSINIEPTGYIMPAKQVNIIVARDIDFTSIYGVK